MNLNQIKQEAREEFNHVGVCFCVMCREFNDAAGKMLDSVLDRLVDEIEKAVYQNRGVGSEADYNAITEAFTRFKGESYEHLSHVHCWDQEQPPACGFVKHTQCCLCDLVNPNH